MNIQEHSCDRLDIEFDHFLLDIKPYVLKHSNKAERQCCASWIKKLCDPLSCGSGLKGRTNRNMYTRLLLHMLKRGVLDSPFNSKPEPGSLKSLPTYMSIYLDEPLSVGSLEHGNRGLPEWVTGELGGSTQDSLTLDQLKDRPGATPTAASSRRKLYVEKSPPQPMCSSPLKHSRRHDDRTLSRSLKADLSPNDSDLEARLNSWNLGILKSNLGGNSMLDSDNGPQLFQTKEAEMKMKILEAKYQEEKLKMQQRHDADVEKILERKNGEMKEMKSMYQVKLKDSEEMIRKLERKVQSVLQQSQVISESKENQIAELRKMSDRSTDCLKNEWEKKLHAAVTEMEQQKFELQKKHARDIQDLLENTNLRLAKLESEHNARSQATEQTMQELELRVKQQAVKLEKSNAELHKVTQAKAHLEIQIASITAELQEAKRRTVSLQKEKEQQSEQHEQNIQKLCVKYETDVSHLHQEHALSAAKASEVMEEFEKTVAQLKQQLQENDYRRQQQVRDQEMKFLQEKNEYQMSYEKKVQVAHSEAENEKSELKRKIAKLEDTLREMENQLDRMRESQRQHIQQADLALGKLKKQVELSTERAYTDMKLQMEEVEKDLIRSKSLREKQAKEFSQQLDHLRQKYDQQMAEQRTQHEQEKTRLQQQHSAEKDSLVQEHQQEVSSLERRARVALQQHQQHTQEWKKRDAQTIADLESQWSTLNKEFQQTRKQHKQQLTEMASLLEEEKQKAILDKEASLERLRSDMERIRSDSERSHQQDKDAVYEKTNSKLNHMEKEYSQKLAKSAQLIAELQTSVFDSKEEIVRLQQAMEKQLKEVNTRWDKERRTDALRAAQANKALQEKVESLQRELHSSEKKRISKELESEEKVIVLHQEYQEQIKGLMPADVTQDLEDTITSLKAQVDFLEKRASVLQEELDACRSRR
ncbi:centrosomal protein of 112 kDa isoform X2 [Gouania willdenowi]|uniref:DUF4485 domain-containing protein n=1 Tax=Gouania willdenowi TaxID=441366 RepID=A0A8C5D7Y2_GOUWI|nr:centrosomal protein of 112 kDa isoform X2 [Gouania willdenowi]